ncbi:MAG TPA: hypothetical protein VGN57_04680 [Pirellulaceae bacterium]|jgi:hypothetical protein|nr:hypothetical protein [Pirellulaceae bacterium]
MTVAAELAQEQGAVSKPSVKRRRSLIPRFRLRTLFVAAVLMSLLLGWYGRHVYRVRQERAAAEALRRVGAQLAMPTFEYAGVTLPADLYGWFPWFYMEEHTSVTLDSADGATDADLAHANDLRDLSWLRLRGAEFTDEGLREGGDFRSLSYVSLQATSVTGAGLAALEGRERLTFLEYITSASGRSADIFERIDAMPNLRSVRTWREPLTVEGMRATTSLDHLERLHAFDVPRVAPGALDELAKAPRLEQLHVLTLPNRPLGDNELLAVCRIKSLQALAMSCPLATDAGFAHIADLSNLRNLHVTCPNVTDAGFEAIAEIETLEWVTIDYAVTDAAFDTLRGLPNLRQVNLPASVSREGAQRFANERPDCIVIRSDAANLNERISPENANAPKAPGGSGD